MDAPAKNTSMRHNKPASAISEASPAPAVQKSRLSPPQPLVRIVDDNAETCASLRFFLESLGFETAVWTDPVRFWNEWQVDPRPGCLLLDIRMPAMSGLELLDKLQAAHCRLPILFLTGHGDVEMAVRALKHGAMDFLLKPPEEEKITDAVTRAAALGMQRAREDTERAEAEANWAKLTDRERDVMQLVAKGLMNKQIAVALSIAEKTVQQHRGSACRKLDLRNAVEAAEFLRFLNHEKRSSGSAGAEEP